MRLLKFENYTLTIEPEALTIKAIRDIWSRDKSKSKERALLELGYVYFMVDPRSTYSFIIDLEDRSSKIIEEEGFPKAWKPDKIVEKAVSSYKESVQTTSCLLLEDTKYAVNNLRKYLREMDFTAVDDKGKPKYPVNTLATAVNQVIDMTRKLIEAEKIVMQEIQENSKMRGQKKKNILEDGL